MHYLLRKHDTTPLQLLFEGASCAGSIASTSVSHTDIAVRGDDGVAVPRIAFSPCPLMLHQLLAVNPLQASSDNGIDI